jgi:heptosyltransferase-3
MDEQVLQEVRQHLIVPPQPELLTILQNAPLLKATEWIKQCKCYLGNDSGMTHMAALIGVPTVALFLPNWVIPMHPLGPSVELIVEDDLEQLPVERVFDCVRKYV